MDRGRLISVAAGREPAELLLTNLRLVNVYTREVLETSVAVHSGRVVGFGDYDAKEVRDLKGRFLLPGLIDSHVHIESSLLSPEQFALLVLPHGTTTVIADPHEIANVCGLDGIRYMIEASRETPLDVLFMLPSCVPSTSFENAGAVLDAEALSEMIDDPAVLGLGEMMDYPAVLSADPGTLAKLEVARRAGKPMDGHAPMVLGRDLMAYRAAGIETDHEGSTVEEMEERLRLGMRVLIREGSAAQNLRALVRGVTEANAHLCSFCTDDKTATDILEEGHIDHILRLAVSEGLDPLLAVQLATINSARGYRLGDRGGLAPGMLADMVVVENLDSFAVESVYKEGVLVAEELLPRFSVTQVDQSLVSDTVHAAPFSEADFNLRLQGDRARVIAVDPGSIITRAVERTVSRDESGAFFAAPDGDIRKLAVIERHRETGNIGLGLVEGFGLNAGAMATTIAHDSHNLIILGDNDKDMAVAGEELVRLGGGMCIVSEGKLLGALALPVAGLLTSEPAEAVSKQLGELTEIAYTTLGVRRELDPFMLLSFLALPVIPELKVTDLGLFDVRAFDFTPIEL